MQGFCMEKSRRITTRVHTNRVENTRISSNRDTNESSNEGKRPSRAPSSSDMASAGETEMELVDLVRTVAGTKSVSSVTSELLVIILVTGT